MAEPGQWTVERFLRRTRPYVVTLLGVVSVFVLRDGAALSGVVLVVAGLWYWLPVLLETARNFAEGWRDNAQG